MLYIIYATQHFHYQAYILNYVPDLGNTPLPALRRWGGPAVLACQTLVLVPDVSRPESAAFLLHAALVAGEFLSGGSDVGLSVPFSERL